MNVYLDIETIPGEACRDEFIAEAMANFKAPSSLTKTQACADLGMTGDNAKYTSKDDAIALWVDKFKVEKAPEVAEEAWRKTSFDGAKGQICSIAWKAEGMATHSITDKGCGEGDEDDCLGTFFDVLHDQCHGRPPFFIGQYIGGFDLKFIWHRAVILGIKPPFKLPFDGRHDKDFYCTQQAWAGFKGRMSQDNLCKALGIEGKPGDIDGSKVWDFYKAGKIDRIEEYNRDDVEKVEKIYNRLNFKG